MAEHFTVWIYQLNSPLSPAPHHDLHSKEPRVLSLTAQLAHLPDLYKAKEEHSHGSCWLLSGVLEGKIK